MCEFSICHAYLKFVEKRLANANILMTSMLGCENQKVQNLVNLSINENSRKPKIEESQDLQ